jgi:hypothetical protein
LTALFLVLVRTYFLVTLITEAYGVPSFVLLIDVENDWTENGKEEKYRKREKDLEGK